MPSISTIMGFGCLAQIQSLVRQLEIITQVEIYLSCTPPLLLWRESLNTSVQAPGNFKLWICVVGDFDFVKPTCWQFWFGSSHLVGGDFFDQILFSLNLKRTLWPVFGCRLVGWNPLGHIPPLALFCTWTIKFDLWFAAKCGNNHGLQIWSPWTWS